MKIEIELLKMKLNFFKIELLKLKLNFLYYPRAKSKREEVGAAQA